ncbi:MAG: AAA family ATPase [Elainella sp.]
MASMEDLILRGANPFDSLRSINFWHRQNLPEPTVFSIHQDAMIAVAGMLEQVAQDRFPRTVLLDGDSGSGKTFLLGRLKQALNSKAFFVYIPPFPQSDHIWRHILRYTVDSLVRVPAGQKYSQLLLWLKGVLLAIRQRGLRDRLKQNILDLLQTDRQQFIRCLKQIYKQLGPDSIYNADQFFGILHDLTDAKLYPLACEWLRADDLSEESLMALRLKRSIDTEQAAREILANFGRVAINTQPIVLCFDQLESVARLSDGSLDLQSLFNVNTKIHDEDRNFLVIISLLTHTWEHYRTRIDQSHRARIDSEIPLRLINLDQAEALWTSRLQHLHQQAQPQPNTPIYPLNRQTLIESCPGGKTNPRDALRLGRDSLQSYQQWLLQHVETRVKPSSPPLPPSPPPSPSSPPAPLASFQLHWQDELTKTQETIGQIRQFTSLELIEMLKQALLSLPVAEVTAPLLERTKFAGYSCSYRLQPDAEPIGLIWSEDQSMDSFFRIMEACQRLLAQSSARLCLIRAESVGQSHLKGHQLYRQLFVSPHSHLIPDLASVQQLAAYFNLVKDAREGDLVVGSQTLSLKQLQALAQQANLFQDCLLLQALGVVETLLPELLPPEPTPLSAPRPRQLEDYLLSLVHTHPVIGLQTLIQTAQSQFSQLDTVLIQERLHYLQQVQQIRVLNPTAGLEAQLVCRGRSIV